LEGLEQKFIEFGHKAEAGPFVKEIKLLIVLIEVIACLLLLLLRGKGLGG